MVPLVYPVITVGMASVVFSDTGSIVRGGELSAYGLGYAYFLGELWGVLHSLHKVVLLIGD